MAKGMSQTLYIIIAAVVILVAALVILTIFGGSLTPIASMSEARNSCTLQGKTICETTGQLPVTWNTKNMQLNNNMISCQQACGDGCNPAQGGGYQFVCS